MLLPSDVARLVLGYLQEEGLSATSRAFIHESPNLREYAEHNTEDGTIPACVFSIFGKGLSTILNEYVAVKTKESNHQVPAMMTSLWKKLDFTLNQIKSIQNSPAISACQRVRTHVGLANMARQRALTAPATGVACSTVSETVSIISPAQTSLCMLTHSTPVSYSSQNIRLTPSNTPLLNTPRESPGNAVEHRLNPGVVSPGRRKWKRSGALTGSGSASRPAGTSNLTPEPEEESEEIVDENFPQLVIQNARDKILGDKSLQEKLAENINKILSSEPVPQPTKASTNVVEPDQSIDEILGLQGEIHMSDDAIHDILEQTESDPAFQALFELFDCNKTRSIEGEPADGDISSSPVESELPGPSSVANLDSGTTQKEADPATVKAKAGLERKTRKSAPLLKKTIIGPSNRTSRLDNCSAKLLVMHRGPEQCQTSSPTKIKEKRQIVNTVTPMAPQATALSTITNISTMNVASTSVTTYSTISSSQVAIAPVASEAANVNKQQNKRSQGFQPVPSSVTRKDGPSCNVQSIQGNTALSITAGQFSNSKKDTQQVSSPVTSETSKLTRASSTILSAMPPPTNSMTPTTSASPVSVTYSATAATSSSSSILPSSVTASTEESNSSNNIADGNIVSLKIIISDNQEEQSTTDTALNQAISSISEDKIPTIYLSSPAKSPVAPGTPKGNLDEAAQAVSCLQRSESVIASPLTGTSQAQPSYIIQLPFDGTTPSPASYFLVTEPPTTDAQARQAILPPAATVSKGQHIAPSQFGVTSQGQAFPAGSALILPSPMKPMVLPYSVMGQNTLGNMQMGPNQMVAIPSPSVVQHPETANPQTTGAVKPSAGPKQNLIDKVVPSLTPDPVIPNTAASPSSGHRRILCFDSSGESTKATTSPAASTTHSKTLQPPSRTKPAILGGNKPKRRIETVRCSEEDKSTASPPTQKETAKKASRKQEHSIYKDSSGANSGDGDNSQPLETRQRSKSTDRKHNHDAENSNKVKASDSHLSRSGSLDSSQKSGSKKDKEATDKAKPREGRTDKRTQETTHVTANKENELKGSIQELSTSATVQSTTQPKTSKTSSLAKQAAEMLQDIQALRSPTPKCAEHNSQGEGSGDCPKTPSQQSRSKDGESTPRHLMPPNASDMPSCSPASEAGSENSINMAAHTLMILSRAAMARTGTPLKNSLRQEGAGEQSPTSSKETKKRKQPSPTSSPPAKKESKRTPKKKERKKLIDCFPHDLDVDKFLSSLHYDE